MYLFFDIELQGCAIIVTCFTQVDEEKNVGPHIVVIFDMALKTLQKQYVMISDATFRGGHAYSSDLLR